MIENVRVAVGIVLIDREGKILLGKRESSYGKGLWSIPTGHVKWGETFKQTAEREMLEELGIKPKNIKLVGLNNYRDSEKRRQYVNIDFLVDDYDGEIEILEPKKFSELDWFLLSNLPTPMSSATMISLKSVSTNTLCVTMDNFSLENL